MIDVDIIPGWRTDAGQHFAGLRVRLAPGWKTYWRSPGEGGIPPRLDLTGSENLSSVQMHWPKPEIFLQNGLRSIGYTDEVVFPLEVTPQTGATPIQLSGTLEIGVCEDICIPVAFEITADLPPVRQTSPTIAAALSDRPDRSSARVTCTLSPIADGMRMSAAIPVPAAEQETAVIELVGQPVWVSEAEQRREGATLHATVDLVPPAAAPFAVNRSDVRITILSDGHAVEFTGCAAGHG